MPIITGDFETYYDRDYSLSKISEVEYMNDPRFEIIGCSVKEGDGPADMFFGFDKVFDRMNKIDWGRTAFLAHNTRFDGAILAWKLGFKPQLYLDTLPMARATTHPWIGRSSLAKLSEYLGLPAKGDFVVNMIGKRLRDMSGADIIDYAAYCLRDTDNCYAAFKRLRPHFCASELQTIDWMLRMFIEPQVELEAGSLAQHLGQVRADHAMAIGRMAHIDRSVFSSNAKFAALLESMGVEVPEKISKTTGQMTWALAKNDRAFKELCSDPDQPMQVQAALAARLAVKSTIEETRTQKLLNLSLREWSPEPVAYVTGGSNQPWLAVPVRYYGAHTGRAAHDGGINLGNLKRTSGIKRGIRAPKGMRIVHRDSSQIEARVNAWLAGCVDQLSAFDDDTRDVYCEFGPEVYGHIITKGNKIERFVCKTSILGLGYGMGPPRFRHTLFIGNGGIAVDISEDEAKRIVYAYRRKYREIPDNNWHAFHLIFMHMAQQPRWTTSANIFSRDCNKLAVSLNPRMDILDFSREGIIGPNGLGITYPNLRVERGPDNRPELFYDDPYGAGSKLFGGKTTENVVQYLARIVVTDVAVRVQKETGYHPGFFTHDSLDYVVPETEVETWDRYLEKQFAIRPSWAPGLPLASEGGWGVTLAEAEAGANI